MDPASNRNVVSEESCELSADATVEDGRRVDPNFAGPTKKRSCTDCLCCVIFVICILLLGLVAAWSCIMGDYRRIVFPKDSQGKVCGLDYPDRTYLYFYDILSCVDLNDVVVKYGCPTPQVCVSQCPQHRWSPDDGDSTESRAKMICREGLTGNDGDYKTMPVKTLVDNGICAPAIKPNDEIFWRCVPKELIPTIDKRARTAPKSPDGTPNTPSIIYARHTQSSGPRATNVTLSVDVLESRLPSIVLGARTFVTRVLEDLVRTWKVILICILLAAAASFLWVTTMRFCARFMVYFTLTCFVGIFGAATGFCFWRYVEMRRMSIDPPSFYFTMDLTVYFRYATTWLVLGIVSAIILVVTLLILIFLRSRIALATRVLGEASKAVGQLPLTIFWPIFPFALILGVILLWLFVDLNLRSIASSEGFTFPNASTRPAGRMSREWMQWAITNAVKCDPTANTTAGQFCQFVQHVGKHHVPWLMVYNFVICLWLINYILALDQFTLAGTFATFYFADRRQRSQHCASGCCGVGLLLSTFATAIIYHTGSLALGSFLITLLSLIRLILLKLERKLKMAENPVSKFFLRCCGCCFWCLEKFLRFLNKNAYIMMAIYGHGFCRSAKSAFGLIVRNVVRVFVVDKITDFVLIIGKLAVCAFATLAAYAYVSGFFLEYLDVFQQQQKMHLNYMIVPILVIAISSYLVAKAFFTVYEMGVDTIFICVCEDLERNDGSSEKPYFMSKSMMKVLTKPTGTSASE